MTASDPPEDTTRDRGIDHDHDRDHDRDLDHDHDHDLDDIGTQRFPLAIFPLGLLVLVAIVAGLLLADRDDTGLTPPGSTPSTVTVTTPSRGTSPTQ